MQMSELCCSGQNFGVWLGHFGSNSEINSIILITGFVSLHNDNPPIPHPPQKKTKNKEKTRKTPTPNSNTKPTKLLIVKRNDHMHNMTNIYISDEEECQSWSHHKNYHHMSIQSKIACFPMAVMFNATVTYCRDHGCTCPLLTAETGFVSASSEVHL